ncbi:hypothetical protein HK405_009576 [Cladochytrium tenue]|nr:hypothetical protein HK405_009576 [Cladochytrium tenue]
MANVTCTAGTPPTSGGFASLTFITNDSAEEVYLTCRELGTNYTYAGMKYEDFLTYLVCSTSDLSALTATASSGCSSCTSISELECGNTDSTWAWNAIPTFTKISPPASPTSAPVCAYFSLSNTYEVDIASSSTDCTNYCNSLSSEPSYYGLVLAVFSGTPYCYCLSDGDVADLVAVDASVECTNCDINTFANMTCGTYSMHGMAVYKLDQSAAAAATTADSGASTATTTAGAGTQQTSSSAAGGGGTGGSTLATNSIIGIAVGIVGAVAVAAVIAALVFLRHRRIQAAKQPSVIPVPPLASVLSPAAPAGADEFTYPPEAPGSEFSYPPEPISAPLPPLPASPLMQAPSAPASASSWASSSVYRAGDSSVAASGGSTGIAVAQETPSQPLTEVAGAAAARQLVATVAGSTALPSYHTHATQRAAPAPPAGPPPPI